MNKTERSTKLFKAAFSVLFREKKLLLFPLITTGMSLVVIMFFIAPIALYPDGHPFTSVEHWSAVKHSAFTAFAPRNQAMGNIAAGWNQKGWAALSWAGFYFVSMFLATFSNVAFYHEIMQALNGRTVSIQRGYRLAATRWKAILLWSLFAGLVGYILNAIEQRVSFLGKIITSSIGIGWSLASIFVIPTLVRDNETTNPIKLLRLSANTLKRAWGELVIGFVRIDLALALFVMVAAFMVIAFMPILTGKPGTDYFFIIVLIAMPLGLICSVVNRVYQCALFVFATEGVVPEPFDKELLDSAWKVK